VIASGARGSAPFHAAACSDSEYDARRVRHSSALKDVKLARSSRSSSETSTGSKCVRCISLASCRAGGSGSTSCLDGKTADNERPPDQVSVDRRGKPDVGGKSDRGDPDRNWDRVVE